MHSLKRQTQAFTIIELLIVVVVIAILATITIVMYGGIRESSIDASVQSSISSASKKLEDHKIRSQSYPESLSEIGIENTDVVTFQYTRYTVGSFCLSATSSKSTSIAYHSNSNNLTPEKGVCDGHNAPDYQPDAPPNLARTVQGDGNLGLNVSINHEWDSLSIKWQPQSNIQRYELQVQSGVGAPWYYVMMSNGTSPCASSCGSSRTVSVPASTSSFTWTGSIPNGIGSQNGYRIRAIGSTGTAGEWDTAYLANPIQAGSVIPAIKNFKVTPSSNWLGMQLSWDQPQRFAPLMTQVSYELEVRSYLQTESAWRSALQSNGGSCGTYSTNCTKSIPYTTTQLNWTESIPNGIGSGNQYRIRLRAGNISSPAGYMFYSDWSTVSLANPIQASSTIPTISGFTATPSSDWSTLNLSWNRVEDFAYVMAQVSYELEVRQVLPSAIAWRDVLQSNGGSCGTYSTNCTKSIPYTTTQLAWTGWIPQSGQRNEYRIRVRAGNISSPAGYMYYGPWTVISLSR